MQLSRLELPNGRALNEIGYKSGFPIKNNNNDWFLSLKFEPVRYYPVDDKEVLVSVINCYGDAVINNVDFKNIYCPRFYRVSSTMSEFLINLPYEKLILIEDARGDGDVDIRLNLKILFSLHENNFFKGVEQYENNLCLSAKIAKSEWLEKFLVSWGFFESREVILNLNHLANEKQLFEEISKCRQKFCQGKYEEVLRHGYTVLEAMPKLLGYKNTDSMFKELVNSENEFVKEKFNSINKIYFGMSSFTHLSRHAKVVNQTILSDNITKIDAEFFIRSLELLLNYVLRQKD